MEGRKYGFNIKSQVLELPVILPGGIRTGGLYLYTVLMEDSL